MVFPRTTILFIYTLCVLREWCSSALLLNGANSPPPPPPPPPPPTHTHTPKKTILIYVIYEPYLIILMYCYVHDNVLIHYGDIIMGAIASQITGLTIVFSTVYLDKDQRKHQSSASLAFVRGIQRRPVNSPHKWPVTRKMFPFVDVIMLSACCAIFFIFFVSFQPHVVLVCHISLVS